MCSSHTVIVTAAAIAATGIAWQQPGTLVRQTQTQHNPAQRMHQTAPSFQRPATKVQYSLVDATHNTRGSAAGGSESHYSEMAHL